MNVANENCLSIKICLPTWILSAEPPDGVCSRSGPLENGDLGHQMISYQKSKLKPNIRI